VLAVAGVQLFGKPKPRAVQTDEDLPEAALGAAPWGAVLTLQAGYIAAIYVLGFPLATLLYLIIAPIQMRYLRWFVISAQAVFLTVLISGSFIWFFHIRLPKGILWDLW
jgi:hypothetical protein